MGNMVTSFRLRHDGSLRRLDTYKNLPHSEVTPRVTSAEIQCHPSGKWLYVSNRGDDSISIFRVDPGGNLRWRETKKLSVHEPRGFQIDPSGRWLVVAGQNSDDLEVYRISGRSGKLYSRSRLTGISKPVCIQFVHR
jgi:6-phosphogluconolactonase